MRIPRLYTAALTKGTVISELDADRSGITLIQLLVIRPLECISISGLLKWKKRASDVGNVLSHDGKITA